MFISYLSAFVSHRRSLKFRSLRPRMINTLLRSTIQLQFTRGQKWIDTFDFILSVHHEFKLERMHLSQFKRLIINSTVTTLLWLWFPVGGNPLMPCSCASSTLASCLKTWSWSPLASPGRVWAYIPSRCAGGLGCSSILQAKKHVLCGEDGEAQPFPWDLPDMPNWCFGW